MSQSLPRWVLLASCLFAAEASAVMSAPALPGAPTLSGGGEAEQPHLELVLSRWSAQLYGFIELDAITDSTQGLFDLAGNQLVARRGTAAGTHDQLQFGARPSLFGFRLTAPEWHRVRASALLEMDFLGNQPPIQQTGSTSDGHPVAGGITETAFFTDQSFRIRLMALTVATPVVDVLAGQYWALFGWQPLFRPSTVAIQGVPGELYIRTPQLRVSHQFKWSAVHLAIAAAVLRPPERASAVPDGQAGLLLSFPKWTGIRTEGSTFSGADGAAIAVSGVARRFSIPNAGPSPEPWASAAGKGLAAQVLIPLIPATMERRANGLTFIGSYLWGEGIADLFTQLTGGFNLLQSSVPGTPPPCPQATGPCYSAPIDNGLVAFNSRGQLVPIQWQVFFLSLQYFLPGGFLWLSADYSQMTSNNARGLARQNGASAMQSTANELRWLDANLFWDVTDAVRVGFGYARTLTSYNDGRQADNDRFQLSTYFLF